MNQNNILDSLLVISTVLVLFTTVFVGSKKNKKQIHYAFLSTIFSMLLWNLAVLFEIYFPNFKYEIIFNQFYYIGTIFISTSMFFLGIIFSKRHIVFTRKYLLVFVAPIISLIILLTNNYHHLFYVKDSLILSEAIMGKYFMIHTFISYTYIIVGLYYLVRFAIKNSGILSKQSILIIVGIMVPFMTDSLSTFQLSDLPAYLENIAFSFTIICFMFAIFKYDFLNVAPIALEKVVSHMSDGFVVIDEDLNIIKFNKTFYDNFKKIIDVKVGKNLVSEISKNNSLNFDSEQLLSLVSQSKEKKKTTSFEKEVKYEAFEKIFDIDITPIFNHDSHVGTIILFKDITELRKMHNQYLEKERFYSLGQLIGGIAHDINTPLSAGQASVFAIEGRVKELLENDTLTTEESREIANEIMDSLKLAKSANGRIAKTIESVRNHTRNQSLGGIETFSIRYLIELLQSILNHKLKEHNCTLYYEQNNNREIYVKGDSGKLQQVLMNLINNAVESYEEEGGRIEVYAQDKDNKVIITVKDYGQGIPKHIKEHVFKEILTTKGAKGTGMGLFFSRSIITGEFGGKISLESQEGEGTTVEIIIPKERKAG